MIPPSKPSDAQHKPEVAALRPNGPDFSKTTADGGPGRLGFGSRLTSRLFRDGTDIPVDRIRRIAVSAAAVAAAAVMLVVVRAGTRFFDRGPEATLGPAGSLLAPASYVWWIWLPVVAGWLGYALYQWLPRQRQNPRQERFGWYVLASQLLAFTWLLGVASGSPEVLLPVAVTQIAVGLAAVHSMNLNPPSSGLEGLLSDAPLGLSLVAGVLSLVAVLAFILTGAEADLADWGGTVWALVGLVTVMVGVTAVCMTDRGHLAVALGTVWGLSCIAFERLTGTPDSMGVGVGAAVAAFLVLVSAGSRRHQVDHERRRSERKSDALSRPGSPRTAEVSGQYS